MKESNELKHTLEITDNYGSPYNRSKTRYTLKFVKFADNIFATLSSFRITPSGYKDGGTDKIIFQNKKISSLPTDFDSYIKGHIR